MHGLPQQTPDQARADLCEALAHQPPHLSWYQLTLEPNTEFYSRPPPLPDDDRLWQIYQAGSALLRDHGFSDYEVSAWSQPAEPPGTTSTTGLSATTSPSAQGPTAR